MVSFIIVNYNTKELTARAIDSICKSCQNGEFEIIVFDNASTDGSKEFFEKLEYVKYIYSPENLGFAKANNLAFKHSKGDYIYLLNSDAEIITLDVCKIIENKFKKYNEVGILATKVLYPDNSPQPNVQKFSTPIVAILRLLRIGKFVRENKLLLKIFKILPLKPSFLKSYLANYDTNFISQERYIDWASGCSLVIRRNVYEALNGFDENFFLYCEDEDFCKRANMLGFKVLYTPDITVIHYEGGSAKNKQIKEFSVRQRTISELYFFKKHFQDKFSKILIFYKLISVIGSLFNRRFKIIRNLLKDIKL